MTTLQVNGRAQRLDVDPSTPILWALRDTLGMTGTKFGCGAALCGACTVHVDGQATRSCVTPIGSVEGRQITTIEAVTGGDDRVGKAVRDAWGYVGFKGGSEPGVLNYTWLLTDKQGRDWVLTLGWNNPAAVIDRLEQRMDG
mgnify:CR=1 FL=1